MLKLYFFLKYHGEPSSFEKKHPAHQNTIFLISSYVPYSVSEWKNTTLFRASILLLMDPDLMSHCLVPQNNNYK